MASERERRMTSDQLVAVQVLDGCFVRLGRWSKELLFLLRYESGRVAIAYPIYGDRRELLVWVTVIEL